MTPNYTEITIANDSNLSNQAKDKDLQVITGSENPETEKWDRYNDKRSKPL